MRAHAYFSVFNPHISVSPMDWKEAVRHAWKLRDKGHQVPWNDLLIATLALRRSLRVYANVNYFEVMGRVLDLSLYQPGYRGSYNSDKE